MYMLGNHENVVDVRGSLCPTPVIETKKCFENHPGEVVMTIVDNEVSRDNVKKFALSKGYKVDIKTEGDTHTLIMAPAGASYDRTSKQYGSFDLSLMTMGGNRRKDTKGKLFLITKDYIGEGSEELGRTLMKTFLHSLSEASEKPEKIMFINSGVLLLTEDSEVLESLCAMEKGGVNIEACGICLDFYGIKDKIVVGSVTNMYAIVEGLLEKDTIVM